MKMIFRELNLFVEIKHYHNWKKEKELFLNARFAPILELKIILMMIF